MHDYSIDRSPKVKVLFFLTAAAIFGTPYLNEAIAYGLSYLSLNEGWSKATTFVSIFGLFSFLYWCFNKYMWKWGWLRHHLLVPDLNGDWTCQGHQTMKDGKAANTKWTARVTITQSWSHIVVQLRADQSESKSLAASICEEPGAGFRLTYSYANSPDAGNTELHKHTGYVELLVDQEGESAHGSYFTDQHRLTVGTLKLRKVTNGY